MKEKESVKIDAAVVEKVRRKTKRTKQTIGGIFELGAAVVIAEGPITVAQWKTKAERWDKLADKIAKFYPENHDENFEGDLGDIGEAAAIAFGYL